MQNQIFHIDKKQAKEYLAQANQAGSKIVTVDCKKINSWADYSRIVEKALEFPRPVTGSPNRFLDWIRDFSWFDYERYDIFFYHFSKFASKHFQDAYEIYREYEETILPFWEYEAPNCIVGGKTKEFYVYIVE